MEASSALIDGCSFETSNRSRVAVALFHLCIEHHKGIHTLVDFGVLGSAFALLRPQFEAFVRGAWFKECASDAQLRSYLSGNDPPNFGTLNKQLQSVEGFELTILGSLTKQGWRNLCDLTHGGALQVKARITPDEVTIAYKPSHIVDLLGLSSNLSLLAGVQIAAAASNDLLANKLFGEFKLIYEKAA